MLQLKDQHGIIQNEQRQDQKFHMGKPLFISCINKRYSGAYEKSVGLAILMVFLLLYPRFAAEGARYGLLLWYTSVVPSLFPFMVLSSLIVSSGASLC